MVIAGQPISGIGLMAEIDLVLRGIDGIDGAGRHGRRLRPS